MNKLRQGDLVRVIAGRDKGKEGKILKVVNSTSKGIKVLVEGVNFVKKHVKPNPNINEPGGIKTVERPIHSSNVALVNGEGKIEKVGFKFVEHENKHKRKVRYFKSSGELLDVQN